MTDTTARLLLPEIAASQAQKHVPHNEALAMLDTLVMPTIISTQLSAPPGSPAEGDCYIPKATATGAWAGWENRIARYQDGAWTSYAPGTGWMVFAQDLGSMLVYSGSAWTVTGSGMLTVSALVNFNAGAADTAIPIKLPPGCTRYNINTVWISGASHSLTTATAGLFTAAAGGGVAIVTAASAITVSATADATNNNMQSMTVNNGNTESYTAATLYWRVGTAEGAAATASVSICYRPLP